METQADQTTFGSYLLLWSGQLTSLLGSSVAQFVIIWWITLETASAFYLSLASFLGFIPMVILMPFAGVLVDRWNRRTLIAIVDLLTALATLALILLFWSGIISIWLALSLLTLRGVFQAFHSPAVAAIIPLMVPRNKLSRINGLNYLLSGMVTLMGPVIAAFLLTFLKIHQILWIDVITFLIGLIPLLIVRIPSVRDEKEKKNKPSFKEEFIEGFVFIRKTRGFLPLSIVATALNFLLQPFSTLLPYYVKFDHLGDASALAFIMASLQGGIIAGGLLMSVMQEFKRKMIMVAISIYVIFLGYILVALTPTGVFWFMAVGALIMLICVPIANVSTQTIRQTVVPMKMQGRVNSVTMALATAASPIGMIISGTIVEFTGTANLFLGCAVSGILVMTISWFFTDIKHVEDIAKRGNEKENNTG